MIESQMKNMVDTEQTQKTNLEADALSDEAQEVSNNILRLYFALQSLKRIMHGNI